MSRARSATRSLCRSSSPHSLLPQPHNRQGIASSPRSSIKVGTIFEDTKLGLRKWFIAIWLITSHKKGIASAQLARDLGVTQKTAWFMLHRLRYAAHVGKRGGSGRGGIGSGKVPVVGAIERKGQVVARAITSVDAATLKGFVRETVSRQASLLVTDEWVGYRGLNAEYAHAVIKHNRWRIRLRCGAHEYD